MCILQHYAMTICIIFIITGQQLAHAGFWDKISALKKKETHSYQTLDSIDLLFNNNQLVDEALDSVLTPLKEHESKQTTVYRKGKQFLMISSANVLLLHAEKEFLQRKYKIILPEISEEIAVLDRKTFRSLYHLTYNQATDQDLMISFQRGDRRAPNRLKVSNVNGCFEFSNRKPKWHPSINVYFLDFNNRVKMCSNKNFILEDDQGRQVLLFGKVEKDVFSLDYSHPFSALSAMGVALAIIRQ